MPVYRLTPIDPNDPNWRTSIHRDVAVVRAGSEEAGTLVGLRGVRHDAGPVVARREDRHPALAPSACGSGRGDPGPALRGRGTGGHPRAVGLPLTRPGSARRQALPEPARRGGRPAGRQRRGAPGAGCPRGRPDGPASPSLGASRAATAARVGTAEQAALPRSHRKLLVSRDPDRAACDDRRHGGAGDGQHLSRYHGPRPVTGLRHVSRHAIRALDAPGASSTGCYQVTREGCRRAPDRRHGGPNAKTRHQLSV